MELGSAGILASFGLAIILGRQAKIEIPQGVFKGVVVILVFTISLWASLNGITVILQSLFNALTILLLLLSSLLLIGYLVDSTATSTSKNTLEGRLDPLILTAIISGWITGIAFPSMPQNILDDIVTLEVYLVIIVTGLTVSQNVTLEAIKRGGRLAFQAVLLSLASASLAGFLASYLLGLPLKVTLGIVFGMGWYSFAGPFIAQAYGPAWGFTAFLVNILREQFTFIVVPIVRRPALSMVSLGGATTMDNTLPVYTYVYGEEYAIVSIIHGFLLTLLVPLLLGLVVIVPI